MNGTYRRWNRKELKRTLLSFRSLVRKSHMSTDCWEWAWSLNNKGYGVLHVAGRSMLVHRVSVWVFKSDTRIRKKGCGGRGVTYCHKCDNKKCFRPSHIFAGTQSDNTRDYFRKFNPYARTHCIHGHEMTPENTFVRTAEKVKVFPEKECKTCMRNRSYKQYWKKRGVNRNRPADSVADMRSAKSALSGAIQLDDMKAVGLL